MWPRLGFALILAAVLVALGWGVVAARRTHPSVESLAEAAAGADRIVVAHGGLAPDDALIGRAVFEVAGHDQVESLLRAIEWESPAGHLRCACDGEYRIELRRGERVLVRLGWHHGHSVRWRGGPWYTDVVLTAESRGAVPEWFRSRGFADLPVRE
jgi:hypothetical protein